METPVVSYSELRKEVSDLVRSLRDELSQFNRGAKCQATLQSVRDLLEDACVQLEMANDEFDCPR